MNPLKAICGLLCLLVLASNLWSMSRWNEARGVFDDVCYLRQAHLFQRFGLAGFDTDISRDDDHYLTSKLKEIGFPTWNDVATAPCHNPMPALGRFVIQYPPGTGLVMAMFPSGHQVVPLGDDRRVRLCAARDRRGAIDGCNPARRRIRLPCDLSDDQSVEGKLLDGSDHGGVRARGLSDGTLAGARQT